MNWKSIPKQQKELIVLGIMGVVTTFFILSNLVLTPAKTKAEAARKITGELKDKVRKAELYLRQDIRNKEEILEIAGQLLAAQREDLPDTSGRYLWAHKQLSDIGYGLEIPLRIREMSEGRSSNERSTDNTNPSLEWAPYAVEVAMNASFVELNTFLMQVKSGNPYAALSSLEISPQGDSPEKHAIRMAIQWPIASNPRARASLLQYLEASP